MATARQGDGNGYALSDPKGSEVLAYVTGAAANAPFKLDLPGPPTTEWVGEWFDPGMSRYDLKVASTVSADIILRVHIVRRHRTTADDDSEGDLRDPSVCSP